MTDTHSPAGSRRGRPRRRSTAAPAPSSRGAAPVRSEPVRSETVEREFAVTHSAVADDATFVSLGVPAPIVAELARQGVESPFPIQRATLGDSLAGRDVLGRGRTGSGKTIAFAIPTVAALAASGKKRQSGRPRALVLVPTRELANQVAEVITPLAEAMALRVCTIFGGVGQGPQVSKLRAGVDIVVACPGRLDDLIGQRHCRLDQVEVTVLDEADHMADLGFLPVVRRLLDATPQNGQRLLFSATLDGGIDAIAKRYLTEPVVHSVDPVASPVSTMEHHVFAVTLEAKPTIVRELAAGSGRVVLFTRTKHGAKKWAKQLTNSGIPAVELHGNLSQNARERSLEEFSTGRSTVLVATDIAARGIHVDDVSLVVHVDPPAEHKAYLHRSGRTARAGSDGVVVTLMTPDQKGDVRDLAKRAGISPTITTMEPGHALIREMVGEPMPYVKPAPVTAPAPSRPKQPGSKQAQGRRSSPQQPGQRPGQRPAQRQRSRSGGSSSGSGQRRRSR